MGSFFSFGTDRIAKMESEETKKLLFRIHRSTHIPLDHLEELYFVFNHQFPSGRISKEEFARVNAEVHGGPTEFWIRVFDTLDDDVRVSANSIDFETLFLLIHKRRTIVATENVIKRVFRFIDLNNDGFIDVEDLTTVVDWIFQMKESKLLRQNPSVVAKFQPEFDVEDEAELIPIAKLKSIYPPFADPKIRAFSLISSMNVDHDTVISLEEFSEACRADHNLVELLAVAL